MPTGSLDPTFAGDGILELPADPPFVVSIIDHLAVAADGSTLVSSGTSNRFTGTGASLLSKLDSAGSVDPGFGEGGSVILGWGASGLAAGAAGAILVAFGGSAGALQQRLPDGSLDPAFGVGGQRTDLAGATSIVLTPAGIVLEHSGKLKRITTAGVDDASFGIGGEAVLPRGVTSVAALTDGRLAASMPGGLGDGTIVVLTPDGTPDPSFGSDPANPGQDREAR